MEMLKVDSLSFTYAGEKEPALREVSFNLEAGEFALITGETGCGKSTLLRLLKRELAPRGRREGRILIGGRDAEELTARESGKKIGYVAQRPEEQTVTDRVWHELAFGLENLGIPEAEMRRRVAETAQFFGLEDCFDASPEELSGGKRQLLNLAAATVMMPELLLLDEPTAKLDPIAAKQFLAALERLNRETGMTILMAEHRLEDSLSRAGKLIVMAQGRAVNQGKPREVCGSLPEGSTAEGALPAASRLWRAVGKRGECPLNTGEGRRWIQDHYAEKSLSGSEGQPAGEREEGREAAPPALRIRDASFRFERGGRDILRDVCLEIRTGEIFALLGGNGSGKTTLTRMAAGLIRPYSGEIELFGKKLREWRNGDLRREGVAMLPQDPQTLFLRASVREELKDVGMLREELPFDLHVLLDRHPYDLSGGEQQLLALTMVLAGRPRLLLLDEPTGGLDAGWRGKIREMLRELKKKGMSMLLVTHDAEFAAETADRCGLLFRGAVEAAGEPHAFFRGASYYAAPAARLVPGCVTVAEAAERLMHGGKDA